MGTRVGLFLSERGRISRQSGPRRSLRRTRPRTYLLAKRPGTVVDGGSRDEEAAGGESCREEARGVNSSANKDDDVSFAKRPGRRSRSPTTPRASLLAQRPRGGVASLVNEARWRGSGVFPHTRRNHDRGTTLASHHDTICFRHAITRPTMEGGEYSP